MTWPAAVRAMFERTRIHPIIALLRVWMQGRWPGRGGGARGLVRLRVRLIWEVVCRPGGHGYGVDPCSVTRTIDDWNQVSGALLGRGRPASLTLRRSAPGPHPRAQANNPASIAALRRGKKGCRSLAGEENA